MPLGYTSVSASILLVGCLAVLLWCCKDNLESCGGNDLSKWLRLTSTLVSSLISKSDRNISCNLHLMRMCYIRRVIGDKINEQKLLN